jgi:hypothetical protein
VNEKETILAQSGTAQILARFCRLAKSAVQHFAFSGVAGRAFSLMIHDSRNVETALRKKNMTPGDDDDDDREDDAIPPPRPRTPRPFPPRTRARRPSVSDARRLFARRRRTLAGRMGTTSSAPARDSRGDLRQRAAQQAQQPRYTMPQGYANAPRPFQGQQNYAAPRYYGQVRAHPPAVPPKNPPRASRRSRVTQTRHSLVLFFSRVAFWECFVERPQRGIGVVAWKIFLDATSVKRAVCSVRASLSSLSFHEKKRTCVTH